MDDEQLKLLLTRLPEFAKVVNEFHSEAVQVRALEALLQTAGFSDRGSHDSDPPPNEPRAAPTPSRHSSTSGSQVKQERKDPELRVDPELNLRPAGKKSLRDFHTEKKPATNEETYAVVIYYLQHVLKIDGISVNHVFTALKDLKFRVPERLRTILSNAASRQGWFDTSNKERIKMTVSGDNMVEHDLPAANPK